MMERFISGGGTFPVIGSYDEVAATIEAAVRRRPRRHGARLGELRAGNAASSATRCCRAWSGSACASRCTEGAQCRDGTHRPACRTPTQFKLGLFGMNCSGSFATTAPERWQAGWDGKPRSRAARRRSGPGVRPADRALDRLWRPDRSPGHELRDAVVGVRAAGRHRRHRRVLHHPCAARASGVRREVHRHGGPRRAGTVRHQHRVRLERRRVRDVRHSAPRARRAL